MGNHDQNILCEKKSIFGLKNRLSLEYRLSKECPSILSVTPFRHLGKGQRAVLVAQKVTQTHRDKVIECALVGMVPRAATCQMAGTVSCRRHVWLPGCFHQGQIASKSTSKAPNKLWEAIYQQAEISLQELTKGGVAEPVEGTLLGSSLHSPA